MKPGPERHDVDELGLEPELDPLPPSQVHQAVPDVERTVRHGKPLAGIGFELERNADVAFEERALFPERPRTEYSPHE